LVGNCRPNTARWKRPLASGSGCRIRGRTLETGELLSGHIWREDRELFEHVQMPFDLQPILKGQLLELRPLRADDFHELYAVAADPLIWEQHLVRDRYKAEVFRTFFDEALQCGGTLIAIDNLGGKIIGSSRFHGYNADESEIEIGWTFLARSY